MVLEDGDAPLAADLDHGRPIVGIRIDPLNGAILMAKCERNALYVD